MSCVTSSLPPIDCVSRPARAVLGESKASDMQSQYTDRIIINVVRYRSFGNPGPGLISPGIFDVWGVMRHGTLCFRWAHVPIPSLAFSAFLRPYTYLQVRPDDHREAVLLFIRPRDCGGTAPVYGPNSEPGAGKLTGSARFTSRSQA